MRESPGGAKSARKSPIQKKSGRGRVAVRLVDTPKRPAEQRPRNNKRGEDVRERVLEAALECFGTFGFEGTSTRAVADRAGVTHTLVLYHFQSKDQLWIATVQNALNLYGAEMRAHLEESEGQSARGALSAFIETFVRMSARRPQIHRILTMESNQGTKRLEWVIEHFIREHFTTVRDLIRRGQAEGTVRQCDPARLYYHILGAGGTPFTIAMEYKAMTGRDIFSEAEILRTIAFIHDLVFIETAG